MINHQGEGQATGYGHTSSWSYGVLARSACGFRECQTWRRQDCQRSIQDSWGEVQDFCIPACSSRGGWQHSSAPETKKIAGKLGGPAIRERSAPGGLLVRKIRGSSMQLCVVGQGNGVLVIWPVWRTTQETCGAISTSTTRCWVSERVGWRVQQAGFQGIRMCRDPLYHNRNWWWLDISSNYLRFKMSWYINLKNLYLISWSI